MTNIQNKVIHRFIRPISDYEEGGIYASNVIPLDTQAYAYYPASSENEKSGLYFVFGDGQHTYVEIRDGKGVTEVAKEYSAACNGVTEKELEEAIKDMVTWSNHPELEENTRRTIVLKNNDSIVGTAKDDVEYNLAMVSKWDVADFASTGLHTNLNTKDNVTINDTEIVATESVVDTKIQEAVNNIDLSEYATNNSVNTAIEEHNSSTQSHTDIRNSVKTVSDSLSSKAALVSTTTDKNGNIAIVDENGQYQVSDVNLDTLNTGIAKVNQSNTFTERNTFSKNLIVDVEDPLISDEVGIVLGTENAIVDKVNNTTLLKNTKRDDKQCTLIYGDGVEIEARYQATIQTSGQLIIKRNDEDQTVQSYTNVDSGNIASYIPTDYVTQTELENAIADKVDSSEVYTKDEVDTKIADKKAVWGTIEGDMFDQEDLTRMFDGVIDLANGKSSNFVVSYETNPVFNSQEDTLTLTGIFTDIKGDEYDFPNLKIGDNIYVVELNVPDRWVSQVNKDNIVVSKLETTKVTVPTKTSELENDSGFVSESSLLEKTTETWTFTLEDGTEVTKTVVLGS